MALTHRGEGANPSGGTTRSQLTSECQGGTAAAAPVRTGGRRFRGGEAHVAAAVTHNAWRSRHSRREPTSPLTIAAIGLTPPAWHRKAQQRVAKMTPESGGWRGFAKLLKCVAVARLFCRIAKPRRRQRRGIVSQFVAQVVAEFVYQYFRISGLAALFHNYAGNVWVSAALFQERAVQPCPAFSFASRHQA